MMLSHKKILFYTFCLLMLVLIPTFAEAQCAMCRATVESSLAEREDLGSGLNLGILYLASFPYLLIIGIAYFWYRASRKNYGKKTYKTASYR